jgi:hypothetical protein
MTSYCYIFKDDAIFFPKMGRPDKVQKPAAATETAKEAPQKDTQQKKGGKKGH